MNTIVSLIALFLSISPFSAQHTPLPHGTVFGIKPDTTGMMNASAVETFMGKKTRISTTIHGKVIKVTKQKGGWFEIDASDGKVIAAHFKDYNVNIPADLKGRNIIAEGVAEKQFTADDQQHYAGDTVKGKKQHDVKTNPKEKLTFEVKGLMVD
jgi:uncharacterized protein DUF4920